MFDTIILTPQTSLSYKVLSSNSTKGYMQFKKKKPDASEIHSKWNVQEWCIQFKYTLENLNHWEGGGEKKKTGNIW